MLISEARNPVAIPEQILSTPDEKRDVEKKSEGIDFDKMLGESNDLRQKEFETEKKAAGKGEFHIGETKNDKTFREQLEKITGKKQDKAKNKLDQNDYLTLLVTQLKYQDPSKPMEHYEMASQMAQFNTVEQLVGANKSLTNLNKSQEEAKLDKLSQYLEKYIEVEGNNLKLNSNRTTTVARFEMPSLSTNTSIEIKDAQAKVIRTIGLGTMQTGAHDIDWDGKDNIGGNAPPGNYTFSINASTDDGKMITAKTSYLAQVNGVTNILSGGKLETAAGLIDPSKIISVRNHEVEKPNAKNQQINMGETHAGN